MNALRPELFLSIALLAAPVSSSFGQGNCENTTQYPANSIVPDALGALTTISTCNYQSEYAVVTNINAGAAYQFTYDLGGYITVRQDLPGGPVVGQGFSPVTVTAVTAGDLFPHFTVDDLCTQDVSCGVSTVQLFLNCTPPTASISVLDDCPNNSFTADVNITSLGDGAFVNIQYSVNGGPFTTLSGLGLGIQTLGPFVVGDVVNILVEHESDPACNVSFNGVESTGVCPTILTCGGAELNENYCYGPNDSQSWWYQTTGNDPIALLFSAGTIESNTFDNLTIYDGPNNTSPILFDHQGGTFDLTGTLAVSTGNNLFMEMSSDGSVQCSTNTSWEWFWTVGCLDCDIPAASFEVVEDCIHNGFSVEVNVTSTGDASTVDLVSTASMDTLFGVGLGTHTFGPFGLDTATTIGVFNGDNSLCRFFSPSVVLSADSCVLDASCQYETYDYCYENSDDAWFVFQSVDTLPITIYFNQGDMELGDKIIVYNGLNDQSAVIFNGNFGGDLSGLVMSSTNPDNALTVNIISDGTGSCDDGTAENDIIFSVGCGAVGLEEISSDGFTLYPNPSNGIVSMRVTDAIQPQLVRVMDVSGRVVFEERPSMGSNGTFVFDLGSLYSGNYFVQVNTTDAVYTRQVQIQR